MKATEASFNTTAPLRNKINGKDQLGDKPKFKCRSGRRYYLCEWRISKSSGVGKGTTLKPPKMTKVVVKSGVQRKNIKAETYYNANTCLIQLTFFFIRTSIFVAEAERSFGPENVLGIVFQ